jgi:predicted ArsR family transcriptional regulator
MEIEFDTRGRPKDMEIRGAIVQLFEEGSGYTRESLRVEISAKLGRCVSWNTIENHLNDLVNGGMITKQTFERKQRPIVLFLKRNSHVQG